MSDSLAEAPLLGVEGSESERRPPDVLLAEAMERIARAHGPHADAVRLIVKFMEDNLTERITVDDFARTAHYGYYHVAQIFREVTGIPPARFLGYMRYSRAMELLRTTDLKVRVIVYRVGFSSDGCFSSRFQRLVGRSPGEYREWACRQTVESADQPVHVQEVPVT